MVQNTIFLSGDPYLTDSLTSRESSWNSQHSVPESHLLNPHTVLFKASIWMYIQYVQLWCYFIYIIPAPPPSPPPSPLHVRGPADCFGQAVIQPTDTISSLTRTLPCSTWTSLTSCFKCTQNIHPLYDPDTHTEVQMITAAHSKICSLQLHTHPSNNNLIPPWSSVSWLPADVNRITADRNTNTTHTHSTHKQTHAAWGKLSSVRTNVQCEKCLSLGLCVCVCVRAERVWITQWI